jgi:hypothetical protein
MKLKIDLSPLTCFLVACFVGTVYGLTSIDAVSNVYVRVLIGLLGGAGLGLMAFIDRTLNILNGIIAGGVSVLLIIAATLFVCFSPSIPNPVAAWLVFLGCIFVIAWVIARR